MGNEAQPLDRGGHPRDVELLTSHGRVLLFVAGHPGVTLSEIADALSLSTRTVARAVADLRSAERLAVRVEGRRRGYVALAALPPVGRQEPRRGARRRRDDG